jgi:hypothetical protein
MEMFDTSISEALSCKREILMPSIEVFEELISVWKLGCLSR